MQDNKTYPPSKYIKDYLEARNWTQNDLALILGWQPQDVSSLMGRKKKFTAEVAQQLADTFGNSAEFWMEIEGRYWTNIESKIALLQVSPNEAIKKRSELLTNYPTKEMQKRGWLSKTDNLEELSLEIDRLMSRGEKIEKATSFKRTIKEQDLNPAEKFWLYRAISLAELLPVEKYDEKKIDSLISLLKKAAKSSKAVHKAAELLQRYGIRFVVVQPLKNAKIDGAAFWLDENSPVIALSIRFDNIGSFWFALFHELIHIKYRDSFSLDNLQDAPTDEIEKRANNEAANNLILSDKLEKFIRSVAPYYSKAAINQFATELQVHPGIVVGQLQHRKELGYDKLKDCCVPVRELATMTAFTDGWGHPVPQVKN